MGPAIFMIVILGCGDGNAPCQTIGTISHQYQSIIECDANVEAAIENYLDADFPVVAAQCLRSNGQMPAAVQPDNTTLPPPAPVRPTVKAGQSARG